MQPDKSFYVAGLDKGAALVVYAKSFAVLGRRIAVTLRVPAAAVPGSEGTDDVVWEEELPVYGDDGDAHHGVSHRVTLPVKLTRGKKGKPRRAKVGLGLGRIVALHHRSSTSYHIH